MTKKEEILQQKCFMWFWNLYPKHRRMLFHVDNNSVNAIVGSHKKSMGVTKGVADLILVCPGMVYFLELKVDDNTQSKEQIDFEQKVKERGFIYFIIRDFETFQKFIWTVIK